VQNPADGPADGRMELNRPQTGMPANGRNPKRKTAKLSPDWDMNEGWNTPAVAPTDTIHPTHGNEVLPNDLMLDAFTLLNPLLGSVTRDSAMLISAPLLVPADR
jgi:hypothetical protein